MKCGVAVGVFQREVVSCGVMWCCCLCVSERSVVMRCNVVLLLVCFREKWCNAA